MKKQLISAITLVFTLATGNSLALEGDEAMAARINQQLEEDRGNQYDAVKDSGRKPVETAQFFGIKAGMTVLDSHAGAGYNTEILSAAVGPEGVVYAQNYHYILELMNGERNQAMLERLSNNRLPNVKYMIVDEEDMPFDNDIDMVFWGFNIHDVYSDEGEASAVAYLRNLHQALKPGGILAISDHVGDAGNDNAKLHRIEPRIIKALLEKAGFSIDATSDLLANPNDDHSQSIYSEELRYNTDRILIRARKVN
jgi:predicted methyltransferase